MLRDDVRGVGREQTFQRTLYSKTENLNLILKQQRAAKRYLKQSDRHTSHPSPPTFESTY